MRGFGDQVQCCHMSFSPTRLIVAFLIRYLESHTNLLRIFDFDFIADQLTQRSKLVSQLKMASKRLNHFKTPEHAKHLTQARRIKERLAA